MKVYDGPDGPELYLTDPRFSEGGNWLELMVKAKMVCRKVKITYRESPDICPQVFIVAPFKLIQSVMGWEVEDLPTEAKEPRRFSEEQERERAEMDRKEKRNENIEKIVFKVITLLIAVKLAPHICSYYKVRRSALGAYPLDRHIPLPLGDQQPDTDEDYSEYFEDYGLRVAEIQEKDKELTVVFHFWSSEYNLGEWDFEKDYHRFFHMLLTLYGCKASIVKGVEETPQWAATFQFHKGTVKETSFDPLAESAGYQNVLENLVDINPEKYLPFLVEREYEASDRMHSGET